MLPSLMFCLLASIYFSGESIYTCLNLADQIIFAQLIWMTPQRMGEEAETEKWKQPTLCNGCEWHAAAGRGQPNDGCIWIDGRR